MANINIRVDEEMKEQSKDVFETSNCSKSYSF